MTKPTRPAHAVQPAVAAPPAPAEAEKPTEDGSGAPEWAWTVTLVVWGLAFGGLAIYELWTGMISKLFWRG